MTTSERTERPERENDDETELVRRRYNRVAPVYDALEWVAEKLSFSTWRNDQWERVEGDEILELGVGTGKNLPYYPSDAEVTAIDIAPKMLERARRRAERRDADVELMEADAQDLPFTDDTFDSVVSTFVFCSVPDPVQGLREARRVVRPGGQLVMLEHVLSDIPVVHTLMQWFDGLPSRVWGAHIDRRTVGNVREAGFTDVTATELFLDIIKRIEARAPEHIEPSN